MYNYDGKCKNMHGHSYKLFVTVKGVPINDVEHSKNGMVVDFGDIKKIVKDGFEEVQTKFYFIDIYDKDGNRKTPDDINKEVVNIIKEGVV